MNTESNLLEIIRRLQIAYPDAGPMLQFSTPFELLIAVVLSAQSTDEQVNKVTRNLFVNYNCPADFANMELFKLESLIKGVGLYKNKAKNIKNLSHVLLERFHGQVPDSFEALLELPGVGRKSANVILSVAFHKPGLGVDTHVQRVANRLGVVKEKHPEKTERALKAKIPSELWTNTHHLLIFHGRRVCKARKADCKQCVVEDLCLKVMKES